MEYDNVIKLFRNSGLKWDLSASITLCRSILHSCPRNHGSHLKPMLEVMMMMQFLKSTVRPLPSVRRPSSRIWSNALKTSGCAFSISSNRTTEYGRRRTASVRLPTFLVTYVAGRRAYQPRYRVPLHVFGHVHSYHCLLIVEQELGQSSRKLGFATPVGPRNINEPMGRLGSCNPERARRTASATAIIASGCPTTRWDMRSSIFRSFSRSPSSILETGIPSIWQPPLRCLLVRPPP